jgi:hypothetical protein
MEQESEVVADLIHTFEDLAIPYLIGGSWALVVWTALHPRHRYCRRSAVGADSRVLRAVPRRRVLD